MLGFERLERRPLVVEAPPEATLSARHRVIAEIRCAERDPGRVAFAASEMVDAVAGERELEQRAGEAGAFVDEREQAARSDVEPAERAAQIADGFAHQPMLSERCERRVHRENRFGLALGLHQPHADVGLVGAHRQDRVLELAGERQRIPVRALRLDRGDVLRLQRRPGL